MVRLDTKNETQKNSPLFELISGYPTLVIYATPGARTRTRRSASHTWPQPQKITLKACERERHRGVKESVRDRDRGKKDECGGGEGTEQKSKDCSNKVQDRRQSNNHQVLPLLAYCVKYERLLCLPYYCSYLNSACCAFCCFSIFSKG